MFSPEKEAFFSNLESVGLAVTFNDVRLRTWPSSPDVIASSTNITSRFSRNVSLQVPIVSSPMDTVTESEMAIALAKLGGLGILHAGLPIDQQSQEVRRVKLHLNALIESPVTVQSTNTVAEVLEMCERRNFDFRTFIVVEGNGQAVGLMTQNDFDFCEDLSQSIATQMTPWSDVKHIVGKAKVRTAHQAFAVMRENKKKTLPIVDRSGKPNGMYVLSDVLRVVRGNPHNFNLDKNGRLRVGAAVPTDPDEAVRRVEAMLDHLDVAVIDTANGNSRFTFATLKALKVLQKRAKYSFDIVAGNVSDGVSAARLAEAGADGIRVGQGGGSICTTRAETGIGTPQLTAIYNCAKAVEQYNIPVCADGGLKDRGDISIALAAGAESVMMGNMLAATKEAPGELIKQATGTVLMVYRGMGSPSALRDSGAARKRYGDGSSRLPLPEGVEGSLLYKGSVYEVMPTYVQALRKSLEYVGAPDLAMHRAQTRFYRITNAGLNESHPHDIGASLPA